MCQEPRKTQSLSSCLSLLTTSLSLTTPYIRDSLWLPHALEIRAHHLMLKDSFCLSPNSKKLWAEETMGAEILC